ncbi:hypothetical protein GCM10022291_29240 [Postechiella marina]|uniref:DUF5723 domain-containing protein n=1 Tax=Postechiella marina TaxID=943941 RepID=A0ABP8CFQ6_9FLAO
MRKITYLLFLVSCFSLGQNKQILYGFSEIPQALIQNPGGQVTNKWYFGIPLLSHIHFNSGSSGISVYDLFADNGVNFNTKLENAIYSMQENNFVTANQQIEIFSGGFAIGSIFDKKEYISFGVYQEFDFISYYPKDYAILAYEGNQNNVNRVFDASHANLSAELISVWHIGYNKQVNNNFSFGVRGKVYSSILNANSTNNKGSFVTRIGQNNFYNHIFNLDLELRTSGYTTSGEEDRFTANDYKKRLLLGGNLGLGFDIGFTQKIDKQWTVDASLLDIGFISHTKDVENYKIEGNYQFEGVDPLFYESPEGQTADDYWSNVEDEFEELFEVDSTKTKYTTWRPAKLNASLNYAFGKKKTEACNCLSDNDEYLNRVGLQLYAIARPKQPQMALTAYYYRRLFNGLSAKATYTVDAFSFKNVGLGVSAHLGNVNLYLMADNFLEYQNVYNAQSVSLQLGLNYIFNRK